MNNNELHELHHLIKKKLLSSERRKHFTFPRILKRKINLTSLFFQLATLLKSGIPVLKAIELMIDNASTLDIKNFLNSWRSSLLSGKSITQSLMENDLNIDDLSLRLLCVSEQGGQLVSSLFALSKFEEEREKLKQKFIKSLSYPSFLLLSFFLVSFYLFFVLIPQFSHFFYELQLTIPSSTAYLFFFVSCLKEHSLLIISLSMLFVLLVGVSLYRVGFHRLPIAKVWYRDYIQIRIGHCFIMILQAGIPLAQGLQMLSQGNKRALSHKILNTLCRHVLQGNSLSESLKKEPIFSLHFVSMVQLGEAGGALLLMLEQWLAWAIKENEEKMTKFFSVLEPALLLGLGVMVFSLILLIYIPIVAAMTAL